MLSKFEKGKRYRFDKNIHNTRFELEGYEYIFTWVDDVHNLEVDVIDSDNGMIGNYGICPMWCEEIIEGKVFDEGKRYRFSKELFIEDSKQDGDSERTIQLHLDSWVREIDNKFINVIDEEVGTIGMYQVIPRWCEEVVESYLYDSHVGGLYISYEELDYDDLYCDTCNDSDEYLGVVNTISDIVELTKGTCYRGKYIEEFMANITTERDW